MAVGQTRRRTLALAFAMVVGLLGAGVVASYQQVFISYVPVTVRADRSGLLLEKGADVTVRGIVVGKVREVGLDGDGALIRLGIYADQVAMVPAGSTPSIVAPTIFGTKYVALATPTAPVASTPISAGEVLVAADVSTEANDLLGNLHTLLTSVDVASLSSALGAASTTLRGRGDHLGQLMVDLNSYVRRLQPSVPGIGADAASLDEAARIYAAATPELVDTLNNLAVTSRTLHDERDAIPALLASVLSTSHETENLLDANADGIETALRSLRPTSAMLAAYSPMFPCLIASVDQLRIHLDKVLGYQYPSLHIYTQLLPGTERYKYPRDLPKIVPATPPTCFGGPVKPADGPVPYYKMGDGTNSFVPSDALRVRVGSPIPKPLPQIGNEGRPGSPTAERLPAATPGHGTEEDNRTPSLPLPASPDPLPPGLHGHNGDNGNGSRGR